MPWLRLTGADDPRAADYRGVSDAALMRARRQFVAEGRMIVERVIHAGRFRVRSVLVSEAAARPLHAALAALDADVPILICDARDFRGLTGHDFHRGCLALVDRPAPPALDDVLRGARTLVILEAVSNADNVGGVFRNAAAFGADGVLISPTCCDPLYRKAIRTSMGASLRVPFVKLDRWPDDLVRVRARGFTILALTPREPSRSIVDREPWPRSARIALLVGTEGGGLTPSAEAAADDRVRIPIDRDVDSLNLAVAAGIALFSLRR
jgi:tRNA G18 (ribose-2'-O)-methylase SpoU